MFPPRRLLGVGAALLVVGVLAAGILLRLKEAEGTEDGTAGSTLQDAIPSAAAALSGNISIPVKGVEAIRGTLVVSVRATGTAEASARTVVTPLVGGRILSLPVAENTTVAAGQTLAVLDPEEAQLRVREADVALRNAEATFAEMTLFDDRIEDPETRAERTRMARARSGLEAAELALRRAELELERTRIVAPIGGRVASIKVVPGEWVGAATELMTIVDLDPIKVQVQVMEGEVGYLAAGRSAQVTFAGFPGETFTGRIASINPVVGESSVRHARVTVLIPNPGGRILDGMYANAALDAHEYTDRVMVPRAAILERDVDRRRMLFVFDPADRGGRAKWRYVTTGIENDTHVEILANVATDSVRAGEVVLVDGHYSLTHDAQVSLVQEGAAPGAPGQ